MLDHVAFQCSDLAASAAFYDAVLAPLGGSRLMDFKNVMGYGAGGHANFWIGELSEGDGFRESHIAFAAASRAEVLHEPRIHEEYHENYYGAFVRDPDGNNVEAVSHRPE